MSATTGVPLPERVTMPLLALVARGAVDEDYADTARRRVEAGAPATSPSRHLRTAAGVAVFGLLIAIAAVQTSRNADVDSASRTQLVLRINQRRAALAGQQTQIAALRTANADLQSTRQRLADTLGGAQAQLRTGQVGTGFVAVAGPGLQITVGDAPDGDPDGRVRATDLRLLVNALWQAGAEAIAINGRRLTNVSSLVNANIAVQVNRGPVLPPYVVTVVGDPGTLPDVLTDTDTGRAFATLAQSFGFTLDSHPVADLTLPAAPNTQLDLREARPVTRTPEPQVGVS